MGSCIRRFVGAVRGFVDPWGIRGFVGGSWEVRGFVGSWVSGWVRGFVDSFARFRVCGVSFVRKIRKNARKMSNKCKKNAKKWKKFFIYAKQMMVLKLLDKQM